MDGWKQCIFLLMPLCVHAYTKETVVKTISRQPDLTPVCMSKNLGRFILVGCKISTERHRGKENCLLYKPGKQFDQKCDSRFALIYENRTVFIRLASLTSVDRGNYICECSYERGTHKTHLIMTVEGEEDATFPGTKLVSTAVIALSVATAFIIIAGIICGLILRSSRNREHTRSGASEITTSGIPRVLDQDDFYTSLQRPASEVYQNISLSRPHRDSEVDPTNIYAIINQEIDGKENYFRPNNPVYESIK